MDGMSVLLRVIEHLLEENDDLSEECSMLKVEKFRVDVADRATIDRTPDSPAQKPNSIREMEDDERREKDRAYLIERLNVESLDAGRWRAVRGHVGVVVVHPSYRDIGYPEGHRLTGNGADAYADWLMTR